MQILVLLPGVEPPLYVDCSERRIRLGRAADAEVRLPDPTVSPRHATLRQQGDRFLLVDEGSTNGTWLRSGRATQPVRLAPGSPRIVRDQDRVLLGAVEVELRTSSAAEGVASTDLARDLVTLGLSSVGAPCDGQHVERALEELTSAADEMQPEEALPLATHGNGRVVEGRRGRLALDLLIGAAALAVLGASALALYFLVLR